MTERIEVSVWDDQGDAQWAIVGGVVYDRLEFEPRHLDVGTWSMTLPIKQASALRPGRLVTTLFRGDLRTWTIGSLTKGQGDDDQLTVTVSGFDSLSMLQWATAWPDPTKLVGATTMPAQGNYAGVEETVVQAIVRSNASRTGMGLRFAGDELRGAAVISQPAYVNLLDEVLRLAARGGVGVRLGLAPTVSDARAVLQLSFYETQDRSVRVRMSAAEGSLSAWELTETAPTATKAIVAGAGRYGIVYTTPESEAAALRWGGHRERYVAGPDTFDEAPLRAAGQDALNEGAATTTLTMEADEPLGTRAFLAFNVGDICMGVPLPDVEIPDVVTAIKVTHEGSGDPDVTPVFGDPDVSDPDGTTNQNIRKLRRELRALASNQKRGTV